ncbi:LOW QUALITY PROTEIN: hypothetical protein CRUP_017891, partial [Coryphaenoides rupestris]
RKDGLLCDVTLVAGDQKFHAHKAVLAACSDYFRAMFSLCMLESEADEVTLQGVTRVGLEHALDFAYTGQLLELLSLCSHYLIQELSEVNYLDLYRVADLFHLPALEGAVVGFLVDHLSELSRSRPDEPLQLPYRLLREVLRSDRLTSLSEEEIWKLVVQWLEHDCRYGYAEELLQQVRYGLMEPPAGAGGHRQRRRRPAGRALDYHAAVYAQPLRQSSRTRPRFRSLTLYAVGGRRREASRVRELRYFNPATAPATATAATAATTTSASNWSERAPMPAGRSHHCVAAMGDFLFRGGPADGGAGQRADVRAQPRVADGARDADRLDGRSRRMKASVGSTWCAGALGPHLYAVGGRNELRQVLPSVERYCPRRNTWSCVQPFDRSLSCHAGCVAHGLLWVSGGVTNTAQYQNRLMVYDPEQRRVYHVMAPVRRRLYVLGGNDLDYNNDRVLVRHIDSYSVEADQWTRCTYSLLTGQNESGVAVHDDRIYVVGGYSIWTNEPLACIQVLNVSTEGQEEVFYGPTLPFAANGIATCFLPAPCSACPDLRTLQVPHHRIGTL